MSENAHWLLRVDRTGVPQLLVRLLLGVVYIRMGWSKAWDPVGFLKLIREYDMVPDGAYLFTNVLAVSLPWIEIICGVVLILGTITRGAALRSLIMLTGFTFVIANRAMGIHQAGGIAFCDIAFDCGCGGGPQEVCTKLPENVGLWFASLIAFLSSSNRFSIPALMRRKRQANAAAT